MSGRPVEIAESPGPLTARATGTTAMRARRRRLWFGLLTVLGVSRRGFFIPYRYARSLPVAGRRGPYPAIETLLAGRSGRFREVLGWIDDVADDLARLDRPPGPRWDQSWFPRLDAAAAYALVRRLAPRLVVEVGSGHSTRFLARAVADGKLETRIVTIDPAPRADIAGLAVEWIPAPLHQVGAATCARLAAGDVLFIDSSHILMPGSDVDFLFGRVLPALPAGVLVHLHDIFLPDDYPAAWDWRGYNEQLGVLPLLFGGRWEVEFASHFVVTRLSEALAACAAGRLPLPAAAIESSFWLRAR